jgi:hypothetical protein
MRRFSLFLLALSLTAQEPALELPRVDVLDFYGRHRVSEILITQALGVRVGSLLPASKGDAEQRINEIPEIVASHLEAVVREDGKTVLYVGVEERGAPRYEVRPPPGGADRLPDGLMDAWRQAHGPRAGQALRERFTQIAQTYAAENLAFVRRVLRESAGEEHRAAAASIVATVSPNSQGVDDLEFALRDAAPAVRATAVQGLLAFWMLDRGDPARRLRVSTAWFADMLDSLFWQDRMEAARALEAMTAEGDPVTLARLRARALDAVIEMARWKTPEHAWPGFVLAGRIAGWSEQRIQEAWAKGDREAVAAAARRSGP